jgi:hypothetical integral membrane protein (TIGR02206 family)
MREWPFFTYNEGFVLFGQQHLSVLALMIGLAVLLPLGARRWLSTSQQVLLARAMALIIAGWALAYVLIRWCLGDFNYQTDLPLDICNLTALSLPFLMWHPRRQVHEILYFWILAGTLQAILTPHLINGYPNYIFFKYWFVHVGLVIYVIYVTTVLRIRPTFRSIGRSFLALQVYVLFILIINLLLGSNYVYIMRKPPTASALDYMGPWPWYILVTEFLGLVLFVLVYLPVWAFAKKPRK